MNETKTPFSPAQLHRNPRKFSLLFAFGVGAGFVVTVFLGFCFDFGEGDFFAGVQNTANYLLLFGCGLIFLGAIVMAIAFVLGRFLGIGVTGIIAACLFVAMVVDSAISSQPMSRFRKLIWKEAPEGLIISQYQVGRTFSDGSAHMFIIVSDPRVFLDLCKAKNLTKVPGTPFSEVKRAFEGARFPDDTEYYKGDEIEAAYIPSTKEGYILTAPYLDAK